MEAEDQEFKVILAEVVSSRPAWAIGDPVSNNKNNKNPLFPGKSPYFVNMISVSPCRMPSKQ